MSTERQNRPRDRIAVTLFEEVAEGRITIGEAVAALIGAACFFLGIMPAGERAKNLPIAADYLRRGIEKRAFEIRRGDVDETLRDVTPLN